MSGTSTVPVYDQRWYIHRCCNNGIQDHQLFMLSIPGRTMLINNKKVEGSYIEWLD